MVVSRTAGKHGSWELTSDPQQEAEKELTGNDVGFSNLKAHPLKKSDTSSNKAPPRNPSQTVPPYGGQALKKLEPTRNILIQTTILKSNHFETEVSCGF